MHGYLHGYLPKKTMEDAVIYDLRTKNQHDRRKWRSSSQLPSCVQICASDAAHQVGAWNFWVQSHVLTLYKSVLSPLGCLIQQNSGNLVSIPYYIRMYREMYVYMYYTMYNYNYNYIYICQVKSMRLRPNDLFQSSLLPFTGAEVRKARGCKAGGEISQGT